MKYPSSTASHSILLTRALPHAIVPTLLILVLAVVAAAQTTSTTGSDRITPIGLQAGAPAGSYSLSDFENINLYNGNLSFRLPLVHLGGRGTAGHTILQALNTKQWSVKLTETSSTQSYTPVQSPFGGAYTGYGVGKLEGRKSGFGLRSMTGCGGGYPPGKTFFATTLTTLTFKTADGTEYDLRDAASGGARIAVGSCPTAPFYDGASRGKVFISADGNATTFTSDTDIFDQTDIPQFMRTFSPSGLLVVRDGTRYRIDGGQVTSITDRNGNKVTFGADVTDSLGRTATVENFTNDPTYGLCDRIKFKGFGGAWRYIYIVWKDMLDPGVLRSDQTAKTRAQLFPELNGASSSGPFHMTVVSSVVLPDGRSYQFQYNSYGEVARVVLPTGGAIEYDMAAGSGVILGSTGQGDAYEIYRRLAERRTYTNGADASSLTNKTVYTRSTSGGTISWVQVEQFDGSGVMVTSAKHYFNGDPVTTLIQQLDWQLFPVDTYPDPLEGRETTTEIYNTNGVSATTVLQTAVNTWENGSTLGGFNINPRIGAVTTTLNDVNLVAKKTFAYDQCTGCNSYFNNQTDVYEYDFGPGGPGPLVRRTHTDFVTAANYVNFNGDPNQGAHIRSLPSLQWISSDLAGATRFSRTEFEYDNYSDDPRHKPLVSRTSITGHDAAYSASFTVRGNATGVTSYANASALTGPVTVSTQYDIAGNAVAAVDGMGKTSTVTFGDSFGGTFIPNTYAFAPTTSSPVPDPTGQYGSTTAFVTTSVFDFWTGKVTSTTDTNNQTSIVNYDDPLDRPTQAIRAVGTSLVNQTTIDYDDVARTITTTTDLNTNNDNALVSISFYDGLGRTFESRQYEGGTNYIATETKYDALGRPFKTSSPYRPWQSETAIWTTTTFDALGRVLTVTTPDARW